MSGSNCEERQRSRRLSNSLTGYRTHLGDQTKLSMASSILVGWRRTASSCVTATEAPRPMFTLVSVYSHFGGSYCDMAEYRESLRLLFQHNWKEEDWTPLRLREDRATHKPWCSSHRPQLRFKSVGLVIMLVRQDGDLLALDTAQMIE